MKDNNEILVEFGKKLRFYRQQKNYSQEKIAELTGLDRTYISGLERGERNPSFLILNRLVNVLKIQPNDLFSNGGD